MPTRTPPPITPDWSPVVALWADYQETQRAYAAALAAQAALTVEITQAVLALLTAERREALGLTVRWDKGLNRHEAGSLRQQQARWDPELRAEGADPLAAPWASYPAWCVSVTTRRRELGLSGAWDRSVFDAREVLVQLAQRYHEARHPIDAAERTGKALRAAIRQARQTAIMAAQTAWVLAEHPELADAQQQAEALLARGVQGGRGLLDDIARQIAYARHEAPTWAQDGPGAGLREDDWDHLSSPRRKD